MYFKYKTNTTNKKIYIYPKPDNAVDVRCSEYNGTNITLCFDEMIFY